VPDAELDAPHPGLGQHLHLTTNLLRCAGEGEEIEDIIGHQPPGRLDLARPGELPEAGEQAGGQPRRRIERRIRRTIAGLALPPTFTSSARRAAIRAAPRDQVPTMSGTPRRSRG
jgi:hypothetical protein